MEVQWTCALVQWTLPCKEGISHHNNNRGDRDTVLSVPNVSTKRQGELWTWQTPLHAQLTILSNSPADSVAWLAACSSETQKYIICSAKQTLEKRFTIDTRLPRFSPKETDNNFPSGNGRNTWKQLARQKASKAQARLQRPQFLSHREKQAV